MGVLELIPATLSQHILELIDFITEDADLDLVSQLILNDDIHHGVDPFRFALHHGADGGSDPPAGHGLDLGDGETPTVGYLIAAGGVHAALSGERPTCWR